MIKPEKRGPQQFALLGYLIAAAVLLPLGWWLKANTDIIGWLGSLFG